MSYFIISFENTELPIEACFLDSACNDEWLPYLSEEAGRWFFHFTVCLGVNCSEKSFIILKHSKELQYQLNENAETILAFLYNVGNKNPLETFKNWLKSLTIMQEKASQTDVCSWFGLEDLSAKT